MSTELQELQEQIAELRSQRRSGSMNGPFGEDWEDMQRETQKQINEYRFKLQKAEQEITTLQSNLARAETQVIRYKSTAEASEKSESELKIEKRKLQREVRMFGISIRGPGLCFFRRLLGYSPVVMGIMML